jgi:hypothetical protein
MTQVPTRETPLKTRVDRFEKLIIAAVNIRRKILEVETGWSAKVSDEQQKRSRIELFNIYLHQRPIAPWCLQLGSHHV